MTPTTDSTLPIVKSIKKSIDQQIENTILDSKEDRMKEQHTFKNQLGALASILDSMYQILASNLMSSLLRAHDESGKESNRF